MARNTSDSIEEYIKELLGQSGIAEIQRSNLADTFQVVPSQINYVIKTRFTESRGYIVESKTWRWRLYSYRQGQILRQAPHD